MTATQEITIDSLFIIAEEGPFLNKCGHDLYAKKENAIADNLIKLQQDVGVAIDIEISGNTLNDLQEGSISYSLYKNYKAVTETRLKDIFNEAYKYLSPENKEYMGILKNKLGITASIDTKVIKLKNPTL